MDKIKILVVDDESRMRKLVKDFLEERYQVIEAGDGMEAMEQFYDVKDIALIILDVMMPEWTAGRYAVKCASHPKFRLSC